MTNITANELKTRGVSAISKALEDSQEAIVSVRGKDTYVVMDFAHYTHLRTCEIEAAIHASRADIEAGRYIVESPEDHMKRLDTME